VAADTAPSGGLRGAVNPLAGGVAPWASFTAQTREHVAELQWPRSNATYERMLTDDQAFALYSGWVLPAENYGWWLHPNGRDVGAVEALAEDLGLPVFVSSGEAREAFSDGDSDTDTIEHTSLPDEFDFGDLLHEALFGPVFGHYYFEWAGELDGATWRLRELAPLHPATIGEIRARRDGRLDYVKQAGSATFSLMGGVVWASEAPKIGPDRLVPFVWWPDASRRWLGRSMYRPLYRNWLCKDVLIRVDVTNHERAGGVPWVETDERYAGQDLEDLKRLASEFRVDEEGGAALPPGALLRLARAGGTDVVGSVRYHDQAMARVWHAMVRELGQTPNGSRALGGTFADLETLARRSLAEWVRRTVNRYVCARWWWWNFGERNAPVLRFTPPALEAEVEQNRTAPPEVGDGPPPVAAAARPSPHRKAGGAAAASEPGDDPTGGAFSRSRVPDRDLRRQPYDHEVAAAVDFAALEVAFDDAADRLDALFLQDWLPSQLAALADSIVYTRRGTARTRLTAADMARLRAPVVGSEAMAEVLLQVAQQGAVEAVAELGAQGADLDAPSEATLRGLVADHANAVAQQTADGLSLAASRRAVQLTGSGLTAPELAGEVTAYIEGLEHAWERDQLAGAAQQALNAGRLHVFERVEAGAPYASELLDSATCDACRAVDGRRYVDVAEARRDYPSGGFRECRGGPRCRGTVVLVMDETQFGESTVT
jgi:hypothetical protein